MVRVVSSGFSTPRSRHSSGEEMIDRFSAMRAISALHEDDECADLRTKSLVIACDTDTNDSFSGHDSDSDRRQTGQDSASGDDKQGHTPEKRKQRRRERNKVSAQHYRLRRREQTSATQKMLGDLESEHKRLMEKIRKLESEKHIVEDYLKTCVKIPWCPYHHPCTPKHSCGPTSPTTTDVPTPTPAPLPKDAPAPTMPMPVGIHRQAPVESGSSAS